ncbi:MAG: hypothetical protein A3J07_03885 [Candidatus Doudnabacteria bacterium RIFCSPLOWO2_02_FULL_49_13]|uniref:ATP-grasp domain-containing protein n=1 Tax=Candidatus Doudnabacteria bacterium RIFCSPHIGHO2_12_FULL_48_16 TaxID=1817838 RepID=A0A1F5PJL7_9BACT|nr:MAG: hypothetical protein A3B77_02695 [Candidatus Doudnabacteria bacterium RIFCSPHIGHO2_02_FULL_49_24]OGE89614.1 MAG: hypothetical protein A2760_03900 [Candidatus Doudnabacteria bacterium RIFCSPHIGHO2_01_FULL_50_67]OGE90057.1 MAG: hypothetical protein A3E29_03030 [Candidatus Doudnabacteria bacterium RIFCSPHIGHO2_12_FULL_48_16]OGE96630.1 MAG: hypothetical protein A2990_00340 [Candidatus Doudnabacteria bacterium RIFCSPLOWO2_01_FULL_49_40]OGF02850.1 MAG: hypothetical protein A3H14_00815 [Candid
MDAMFVSMKGDERGELALSILAQMKRKTLLLAPGEKTPEGSIALFSFESRGGSGRRFMRCSAIRVLREGSPPCWVTTPFVVGIRPKPLSMLIDQRGFQESLYRMSQDYLAWMPNQGRMVPWACYERDPKITPESDVFRAATAWLQQSAMYGLFDEARRDLRSAMAIRLVLQRQGGYYYKEPEFSMQVSPDVMHISAPELELCRRNGRLIFDLWRQSINLYRRAIDDPELAWVAKAVEGPLTPQQQKVQRFVARNDGHLPLFARADLSSVWFLVEVQERLGGLGLMQSWAMAIREVLGTKGLIGRSDPVAEPFAEAVKSATGNANPFAVLICPEGYEIEQGFLAQALAKHGVDARVLLKTNLDEEFRVQPDGIYVDGRRVDFIYRREINAATLAESEVGRQIVNAAVERQVVVEPPLNMIYDTKVPLALVHDPRVQHCFTDELRQLVPPTGLMPSTVGEGFWVGEKCLTLQNLIGAPWVVKYAGPNIQYGFGGRGVFNTTQNDEGIVRGVDEVKSGHPWIVQQMDETRFLARHLNGGQELVQSKVAARITLHYRRQEQDSELFLAIATNRPHWKAIGNPDSIVQEIRVRNE